MAAPDKPALAAGVERRDFGSYGVLAPPGGGSMLHLEPDEYALLDLMDGTHSEAEIELIAGAPVNELVREPLWDGLSGRSPPAEEHPAAVTLHGVEFRASTVWSRHSIGTSGTSSSPFRPPSSSAPSPSRPRTRREQIVAGRQLTVSTATPILAVVGRFGPRPGFGRPPRTGHALVMAARNRRHVGMVGSASTGRSPLRRRLPGTVPPTAHPHAPGLRRHPDRPGRLWDRRSSPWAAGTPPGRSCCASSRAGLPQHHHQRRALPRARRLLVPRRRASTGRPFSVTLVKPCWRLSAGSRRAPLWPPTRRQASSSGLPDRPRVRGVVGPLRRALPDPLARWRRLQDPGGLSPVALRADRHPPLRGTRALFPKSRARPSLNSPSLPKILRLVPPPSGLVGAQSSPRPASLESALRCRSEHVRDLGRAAASQPGTAHRRDPEAWSSRKARGSESAAALRAAIALRTVAPRGISDQMPGPGPCVPATRSTPPAEGPQGPGLPPGAPGRHRCPRRGPGSPPR